MKLFLMDDPYSDDIFELFVCELFVCEVHYLIVYSYFCFSKCPPKTKWHVMAHH